MKQIITVKINSKQLQRKPLGQGRVRVGVGTGKGGLARVGIKGKGAGLGGNRRGIPCRDRQGWGTSAPAHYEHQWGVGGFSN